MTIFSKAAVFCAVVALATPAWARQTVSRSVPDDPARPQVQMFEMLLKAAVENGGRNFAKRAQEMVPTSVIFEPADAPAVTGVVFRAAERNDFVFHIQVPGVMPALLVMNMMANRGAQRVSNPNRVQADGLIVADPMGPAGVTESNKPDLEREYAINIRAALVDAIVENSGGLPLTADDSLLVYASDSTFSTGGNPFYKVVPRKLVLSISGADLMALRQGKITREEARQRVKVASF